MNPYFTKTYLKAVYARELIQIQGLLRGEFRKRRRNRSNKILYLSLEAPDWDRSSGANRLFEILNVLQVKLGYEVHFFCHTPFRGESREKLGKLGVRVTSGENLFESLVELKRIGVPFDTVIFSWWEMAEKYLWFVKGLNPGIKVVTDTVDVHWLREGRGNKFSAERKRRESQIYRSSACVLTVTDSDRTAVLEKCGSAVPVEILSNIHRVESQACFPGSDIIFLGGFRHEPNQDSALRAYQIFKKFTSRTDSKARLLIIGSDPTKEILALHDSKKVIVTGYVPELKPYFEAAKVLLAPLTWGAGIKGKICQSVVNRVPVVTSPIGVEGTDLKNGEDCWIAHQEEDFVKCLEAAFSQSFQDRVVMCEKALEKILNLTSEERAAKLLRRVLAASEAAES
jgi:O-antigen biosynthesis protein